MTVSDSDSQTRTKDLENLDKHLTEAIERAKQELLGELRNTRLEVAQLRNELREIQEQVPPKLRTL